LQLGINNQRISLGVDQDGSVFDGNHIGRQALVVPGGSLCFSGQQVDGNALMTHRNLILLHEHQKVLGDDLLSEALV
jgi:hypothetical protein